MVDRYTKLKELMLNKFEKIIEPERGEHVIILREELVDQETNKKNFEIGIGKIMKFATKISCNGKTYRSDELGNVKDGSVIVQIKELTMDDPRKQITIVKTPKEFYRAIDEAAWNNALNNLDDILKVVEEFNP
ncbi:MAG: hypothetical protein ACTSRA_19110 [Promethearchaeota archaeon]